MQTITANLTSMARDLEDAQKKTEALARKGPKTNAQKMADATARLESTTQQWDSQAPFIFETLQALDEQRVNQLRDLLTQYETHESDQAQRNQSRAADTLASMLEISTEQEIASFKERILSGRPRLEKRATASRQSSNAPTSQTLAPPPPPPSSLGHHDDDASEHSGLGEGKSGMLYYVMLSRDWETNIERRVEAAKPNRHDARPPSAERPRRVRSDLSRQGRCPFVRPRPQQQSQ